MRPPKIAIGGMAILPLIFTTAFKPEVRGMWYRRKRACSPRGFFCGCLGAWTGSTYFFGGYGIYYYGGGFLGTGSDEICYDVLEMINRCKDYEIYAKLS